MRRQKIQNQKRHLELFQLQQLVFLQELLSEVLEVTLLESGDSSSDSDLSLTRSDLDSIAQVASFASDLDLLFQEVGLKGNNK